MPHQGSGLPARRTALGMGYNRYFDDFENGGRQLGRRPVVEGVHATPSAARTTAIKNDGTADNDGWKAAGEYVEIDMNRDLPGPAHACSRRRASSTRR